MLRSFLFGAVVGLRSMTPLAQVSVAAARGRLPQDSGAPSILARPVVAAGAAALALGEIVGDKWRHAPDRISLPGMAARLLTGALAGVAVSPRGRARPAAVIGAMGAAGASYLGFALRARAMRRAGQFRTGLVEDAIAIGAGALLLRGARL